MTSQILVLTHGYSRGGGSFFSEFAETLPACLQVVDLLHQPVPDLAGFAALIVACPAVDNRNNSVFAEEEKRVLQAWNSLDRPCLGLGGGHLLLAEVMGAGVGPNFMGSFGVISGHLTHDGRSHPLFAGLETPFPLCKRHDRAVQTPVPRSILLLATSNECVVEAFCGRGRPHMIGLQFENYYARSRDHVEGTLGKDSSLKGDVRFAGQKVEESFGLMMENFIGMLG